MDKQNCLGYITGIYGFERLKELVPETSYNPELPLPTAPEASPAVIAKLNQLGFDCRQVSEEEQLASSEKLIAFWGLFPTVDWFFGCGSCSFNFHFAQFVNGVWEHKWGWGAPPSKTSLGELVKEYGQPPMFFAIRKRTL